MVRPILCYGAQVWSYQYNEKVESVHLSFCKRYCLLPQQTSANVLDYHFALCTYYMTQSVKYWIKLLRMDTHHYPFQCYKMLKQLDDTGRKTWASNIKQHLFSFGFGFVWFAQDVGDSAQFITIFKKRVTDIYTQKWNETFHETSKTDSYKCYKSLLSPEKYLFIDLPFVFK